MSLYFDNEKLFDREGHLTDDGLYALKDGTLDDLGALEAAEHLSFCDLCLLRYTDLIDAAPACLQEPMRDLIPQVQNLMRLRRFRIMTNRYVSAAAAGGAGLCAVGLCLGGRLPADDRPRRGAPGAPDELRPVAGHHRQRLLRTVWTTLSATLRWPPGRAWTSCNITRTTARPPREIDTMKKNALLTFIFACVPGAGQMYYGYMQRGLSPHRPVLRLLHPGRPGQPAGHHLLHRLDVQLFRHLRPDPPSGRRGPPSPTRCFCWATGPT